jgi:hypothetical protein
LADLETEAGDFHDDNTGVHHFGFSSEELCAAFTDAGFADVRISVAYVVQKPVAAGTLKDFPILLLTGRKPATGF